MRSKSFFLFQWNRNIDFCFKSMKYFLMLCDFRNLGLHQLLENVNILPSTLMDTIQSKLYLQRWEEKR